MRRRPKTVSVGFLFPPFGPHHVSAATEDGDMMDVLRTRDDRFEAHHGDGLVRCVRDGLVVAREAEVRVPAPGAEDSRVRHHRRQQRVPALNSLNRLIDRLNDRLDRRNRRHHVIAAAAAGASPTRLDVLVAADALAAARPLAIEAGCAFALGGVATYGCLPRLASLAGLQQTRP